MVDLLVDSDDDEIREQFLHYSQRRKLDKAGRLLLDDDARAFAGLGDPAGADKVSVVVCGTGRYLQVWEKDAYYAGVQAPRDFARGLRKVALAAQRRTPEAGR
jgi:DNA-binding transcriptional regulator/RsmH inhibitor MraZ